MKLRHFEDFNEWYDDMTGSDPYPGLDLRLNLSKGLTPDELRYVADQMELSCCGIAEDLAVIDGDVYWRYVDYGH